MNSVLEVQGLSHRYGGTQALVEVDLRVDAGECVALLGPNGAGKTTLVSVVTGLLARQHGSVLVAGGDPRFAGPRRRLGVVLQSMGFPSYLKVAELVSGAAIRGGRPGSAAGPILAELELAELANRRAAKLSGGQQRRVQLAMALVTQPDLLVLDEPTTGLDVPARRRFWQLIAARRAAGVGVLVTTHLIEESASVADRVVVVDHGRILADADPDTLVSRLPDRTVLARTTVTLDEIGRMPGVLSVTMEHDLTRITTRDPERLLRVLLTADPGLDRLRVQDAGLEEAVLGLTEHHDYLEVTA